MILPLLKTEGIFILLIIGINDMDDFEEFHRKWQEKHNKSKLLDKKQFKGKQLEDVLKKLDELDAPVEKSLADLASLKKPAILTKKRILGYIVLFLLMVFSFTAADMCFDSVLFFNDKINWIARYILFSIGTFLGFYLMYIVAPRRQARLGITNPLIRYSPFTRILIRLLAPFLLGGILSFLFYIFISIGMNFLNSNLIKINTDLKNIHKYKGLYECRVLATREKRESGTLPDEVTISLFPQNIELPLKEGGKVVLIGRESFAGIIIDRIQKAP